MKLVKPTKKYTESWKEAMQEFRKENPESPRYASLDIEEYIQNMEDYSQGKNLPNGFVASTMYWLIDDEKFVGYVEIHHELNDKLTKEGGHVGYAIRPTERRKGYGKKILELTLPKAQQLGIKKVLITCDDVNVASWKIIEKNGGVLQDKIEVDGKLVRRYWIDLE
ncbi:GNAT family N-acetyltransferase [Patescibacteria group bacterium]